jgi:hypothetical protein
MAGPDIKGAIRGKFAEKGYDITPRESIVSRLTDTKRWKQLASESAVGRAAAIGEHMKELAAGKATPDPMLAMEGAMIGTFAGKGGRGPANLGVMQKGLLKEAGQSFRSFNEYRKAFGKGGLERKAQDEIARRHLTGIKNLPDVVAAQINQVEFHPDMKPLTSGSSSRKLRDVRLNPRAVIPRDETVMHEATHAFGRGDAIFTNTKPFSRAEKATNYRSAILDSIASRYHKELTPIQKRFMYKTIPHEQMAQRLGKRHNQFKPEDYATRADADKAYLQIYNKEADYIIDRLKKTAPKVYKKATKRATRRMEKLYGEDWKKDLIKTNKPKKKKKTKNWMIKSFDRWSS